MKVRQRILIILLVLLVSSQPVLVFASDIISFDNGKLDNELQLLKVAEQIIVDDEVTLLEGALLYGYVEGELVHIQYKDKYIDASIDQFEYIKANDEQIVPEFVDYNVLDTSSESIANQDLLYGYSFGSHETVLIHNEIEIPLLTNGEYKFILIGNVPHYLNEEDLKEVINKSSIDEETMDIDEEIENDSDEVVVVENEQELIENQENSETQSVQNDLEEQIQEAENNSIEESQEIEAVKPEFDIVEDDQDKTNNVNVSLFASEPAQLFKQVTFSKSDKYFLAKENLPVYDNRSGKLVKVGELKAGQVYPRYESSPSWHRIQFGHYKAFVKKEGTEPASGSSLKNINKSYSNQDKYFTAKEDITVYDNSSGNLVSFGTIKAGQKFSIAHDYGGAWIYIIFADRVGYIKSEKVHREYFMDSDKYFRVTVDNLPIYDNRSGRLVKVGELIKDEVYPRGEGSPKWHAIDFNGFTAYVESNKTQPASGKEIKNRNNGQYKNQLRNVIAKQDITVYDNSTGNLVPFAKIAKGQEYSIAKDYNGSWIYIILADRIGYIRSSEVKRTFISSDKYFKVINNTPIYDNRSGKLVKVGELVKGQEFRRGVGSPSWQAIDFGDFTGYVHSNHAEPSNGKSIKNSARSTDMIGYLTPKVKVPVYDNSGKGSMVAFANLERGTKYPIVKEYNSWFEINLGGRYGFVKRSDVNAEMGVKIFIDPGHGGTDSGARGYGLNEKDIVLDIGRSVANELRKYKGVEVVLSRSNDSTLSLSERTRLANNIGADYFVSLHINAAGGVGFESFIFDGPVSQETRNRQIDIHTHLANWLKSNSGIRDRGMKRANFHVLRESNMPAILLEYMFIDNLSENNLLKNTEYRRTLGRVTAEAIAKSFNLTK